MNIKTFFQSKKILTLFLFALFTTGSSAQVKSTKHVGVQTEQQPIILKTMGSLMFGGTVSKAEDGNTFHGDHGYAQYYIPQSSRSYPIVLWHGIGQSGKSWETTPDGREGYMSLLPRRDWPVYIIDQPRRGRAGHTQAKTNQEVVPTTALESEAWNAFRLGVWAPPTAPTLFPQLNFPTDSASIDQFLRWQTPDTGIEPFPSAEHRSFMAETVIELFKEIGPGILLTHSHSGQYGWATAMEDPSLIKAVIAYEPGAFSFPESERPAEIQAAHTLVSEFMQPQLVSMEEFEKLTRMPILIIYGDNIAKEQNNLFNLELWRIASERAKQFVEAVNRHGGDAQLVFLPEIGIHNNTHFPFADLNNLEIVDHLTQFLHKKGLDGNNTPHNGPKRW